MSEKTSIVTILAANPIDRPHRVWIENRLSVFKPRRFSGMWEVPAVLPDNQIPML